MSEPIAFSALEAHLSEPADTLILFHRSPDADAIGSAFTLRSVLEALGSRAWCVCGDEVPSRLRFLMNGAQESVLPDSIPTDFAVGRIVSVDTASAHLLGSLEAIYGTQVDLMIDHHGSGEPYATYCYIQPTAAATGEILFDLVKLLATEGRMCITDAVCVDLYAAISGDTGCFRFSNATSETHLRAAELLASGIDSAEINHRLFDSKSMEQLRAESAGVSNLHLFFEGRVAIITFPYALKVALGLSDEHLETLIDVARALRGVEVAICIRQPEAEGRFRVSARSATDFDVSAFCANFGGGGHKKAAGCTVMAADIGDAVEKVISAIQLF